MKVNSLFYKKKRFLLACFCSYISYDRRIQYGITSPGCLQPTYADFSCALSKFLKYSGFNRYFICPGKSDLDLYKPYSNFIKNPFGLNIRI